MRQSWRKLADLRYARHFSRVALWLSKYSSYLFSFFLSFEIGIRYSSNFYKIQLFVGFARVYAAGFLLVHPLSLLSTQSFLNLGLDRTKWVQRVSLKGCAKVWRVVPFCVLIKCITLFGTSQGRNQLFISARTIFMKFHSMTSSSLLNRGTPFSQTVTDNVLFATFPKMRTFSFDQDEDRTIRT